ncbi:MAG: hypothetical protein ABSF23_16395 [Terracidiphilus sp.]|jgi:hypothetical protein
MSIAFLQEHPYLFANLPILVATLFVSLLLPNRDFRFAALFSGLACLAWPVVIAYALDVRSEPRPAQAAALPIRARSTNAIIEGHAAP